MKTSPFQNSGRRAFALIELMVSTAVVAITGIILYYILLSGLTLFTKNTAINMAHQEARNAVLTMEQDIHAAVSIPELTTTSPTTYVTGSGPAAGISFQLFAAGPFQITPSATPYAAGQPNISVRCNGYVPTTYQRLIIPEYQIEMTVVNINSGAGGTDVSLELGNDQGTVVNLPTAVTPTMTNSAGASVAVNIQCFFTDRVAYVVNGTQLWYYPRQFNNASNPTPYRVLANSITSATPFSIPATPLGAPFNRFVAAVNLITADTATSNLNFRAANMFLNSNEPYRCRLCVYQ